MVIANGTFLYGFPKEEVWNGLKHSGILRKICLRYTLKKSDAARCFQCG